MARRGRHGAALSPARVTRALALEQLRLHDDETALRRRHAHALRAEWDAAETALFAGELGVQRWRDAALGDWPDAREALSWARNAGETELALALASAMLLRMPHALHRERLQLAQRCEPWLAETGDAALQRRAWSAIAVAWANQQPSRALQAAEAALALARRLEGADPFVLYDALCEAAGPVYDPAHLPRAQALLAEARGIENPQWPPVRLRSAARLEARIAIARGDMAAALPLLRRLLALSRAAGDPSHLTQVNLADLELLAGDVAASIRTGRAVVAELARERDSATAAAALVNLAAALLADGDTAGRAEARAMLERAWPIAQRLGRLDWCIAYTALLAALEGRFEAAARLLAAAQARVAAADGTIEKNEGAACRRALALVRRAAPALLEQGKGATAALSDEEARALAFEGPG